MDGRTKWAIVSEAVGNGNSDGTKTEAYWAYMASEFVRYDGWLRECGVNYRHDPDLAGWLIYQRSN
jgi:hypothetical protein